MANYISEDQIEKGIIQIFEKKLGYRHLNCHDSDITGREAETDVIIKPLLKKQLVKLNEDVPESAIEEALSVLIKSNNALSPIAANREMFGLIKNGVQVEITNDEDRKEPVIVKIIDFENESENDFLVVSQLWVKGEVRQRPDLIVYINGLPLVFIELKNSNIGIRNAYDDNLTRYKKVIPNLFHYNSICILSNGLETKVGSSFAGYEHFFNWMRVEDEKEVPDKKRIKKFGVSLDYAVLGLCDKKRLLDYYENFIFFYKDTVKICAKNHQFLGVNNAVDNFNLRLQHDADATDTANKGKLGVFWHTQGSGKSYSMIFFTRKVFRKFTGNYTFLIVTDRDDLDDQIYRNYLGAGAFSKSERCRPKNGEELRQMLQTNKRYIFTLIQKFRFDKGKSYPVISDRNDIIVIVDEAHRTQYKDLAGNMRIALPNAQYIAFTGTPLLGSKKLTNDLFGSTVSEYNFQQSVEDGATVPLFYHKRVPEVLLQNDTLAEDFAEIIEEDNLTPEQQEKLEREFAQELSVLKADDRLDTIAKDIVYHFPRRGYLGKGMVISVDKFTAVRMYDKVQYFWKEEIQKLNSEIAKAKTTDEKNELTDIRNWMRKVEMAVVISEEAGEEEKFSLKNLDIKPHRKKINDVDENGNELEDKFKDPKDPLQLVFVCSMWLTGFDAPTVSTLYLDKPMKDHTLMQTIARANRVTDFTLNNKPKKNGLIVDYYNVFRNLKKAFASYGGGTIEGTTDETPVKEKDYIYDLLKTAIDECVTWCTSINIDLEAIIRSNTVFQNLGLFDDYANTILGNDEHKKQYNVYDNAIDALYEACRPEILNRKKEFEMASVIHYLRNVIEGKVDRGDLDNSKRKISELLDESIIAQNTEQSNESVIIHDVSTSADKKEYYISAWKSIDLSKLDIDKLREKFKEAKHKNIEINDLRAFIQEKLELMLSKNSTRIDFAQRLQEIIDKYNSGGALTESYFSDLMNFVDNLKLEEERHIKVGLTEEELELFDLLKKDSLTKDEEQKVKNAAKNLLKRLKEEQPSVLINDWHKDTVTKLQVQSAIKTVLDTYLPDSYDRTVYSDKCDTIFEHLITMAATGDKRAFVN
ncbi:MAG: type site-specific deoxyribonuclease, HsdR family [Bacteroidetes bacterium]|jgi:type I restriction enzyme R subunit|nr:type site-specific deoxyribonuclease, HsdR family [Bacteroidota bacterium]